MALTATSLQRDGWQDQARPWGFIPELGADEELVELQHQISVKTIAAKMLNERIRKLVAELAAKDKCLVELEQDLGQIREDLVHRDNESRSLQTSLELVTAENALLTARLNEQIVDNEAQSAQLENSKADLVAAENERDRLAIALREANELHRIESDSLNDRLEAMTSRTAAAECLLLDVQNSLQVCTDENVAMARKAAEAILARDAANEALGQLQCSLQVKENELRGLEQSRAMLLAGAGILLEAFQARVAALGDAEDRANCFAGRVTDAEAKAASAYGQIESLTLKLQRQQAGLDEAVEAIEALVKRAATAETNASAAQDEIQSLNLRLQSRQAGLDEAAEAIEALVKRAATAEANTSAAQDQIQSLNLRLQGRQADLDETVDAIRSLVTRVAAAEANASAAQDEIQGLNLQLQDEQASRAAAAAALGKAQSDYNRLRGLIDSEQAKPKQAEQQPAQPKWAPQSPATSLLATTISF